MTRTPVRFSIAVLIIVSLTWLFPSVYASEPFTWDFRPSMNNCYTQLSKIYKIPENKSTQDLYGTWVEIASDTKYFQAIGFDIVTSGIAQQIYPSTGPEGGGFSVGYGAGGPSISGTVPYSIVVANGRSKNHVSISIFWNENLYGEVSFSCQGCTSC